MKSLHEILSTLLRRKVSAPVYLVEDVGRIYFYYKSLPLKSPVDIETIREAHRLFGEFIQYTDSLVDEYEFRRRLVSGNVDITVVEPLKQKVAVTTSWLSSKDDLVAGQAEDILHNLYYALKLHSFDSGANRLFGEVEKFCKCVLQKAS
ncbi:MAG: hypothetical protein WA981_16540 [Glaciecola sp.]